MDLNGQFILWLSLHVRKEPQMLTGYETVREPRTSGCVEEKNSK
jgi:hypothetical protein